MMRTKRADFSIINELDEGSFGKVCTVRKVNGLDQDAIYAMKSMKKGQYNDKKGKERLFLERNVMINAHSPYICEIFYSFQSKTNLYFIMEKISGCCLFDYIRQYQRPTIEMVKMMLAEMAVAINYLHSNGIVMRDLKNENIMFTSQGHMKMIDFGLAKKDIFDDKTKMMSFVGTSFHIAPEMIHQKGYTRLIDWWSLGVCAFELMCDDLPFVAEKDADLYRMISTETINIKPLQLADVPSSGILFVLKMLQSKPEYRLCYGHNGYNNLRNHEFFKNIDWNLVDEGKGPPIPKAPIDLCKPIPAERVTSINTYKNDVPCSSRFNGFEYINPVLAYVPVSEPRQLRKRRAPMSSTVKTKTCKYK